MTYNALITGDASAIGLGAGSTITSINANQTWSGPVDFADSASLHNSGYCPNSSKLCSIPGVDTLSGTSTRVTVSGSDTPTQYVNVGDAAVTNALATTGTTSSIYGMAQSWLHDTTYGTITNLGSTMPACGTNLGLGGSGCTYGVSGKGVQVFNFSGQFAPTKTFTITGTANDLYIINITGSVNDLVDFAHALTLVGLQPDQVLFNINETNSADVALLISAASAVVEGDFIVEGGKETLSNATIEGRVLGGEGAITLGSGLIVDVPPPIPEPSEWLLMAGGLGALIYLGRRRLRRGTGSGSEAGTPADAA